MNNPTGLLSGPSARARLHAFFHTMALPIWLCLAGTLATHAAAPANNDCSAAVQIPGSGPFPHLTAPVDITEATLSGDPPVPPFYTELLARSVWYRFTPAANALYTISTCASATASTVNDSVMGLYTSSGGCSGPFVQVAFEDENCNSQAEISAQLLADTTYYVVVWKFDDGTPDDGMNSLQLSITGLITPPNDSCAGAIPVALNVPVFGTTVGAESDYSIDAADAFAGLGHTPTPAPGRDVVYSFTAPSAGPFSIKVWNTDVTEDVALYVASTCPSGAPPAIVTGVLAAANRSRVNSSEEIFCLNLTAGQQIFLFVDHAESQDTGTAFILEITPCSAETEPNGSPETATPLLNGIQGSIGSPGDIDFFSLGAFPSGWRAFVLVDGESSRNSDLDVRIVTTNSTIEFDDNNNDTLYADSSPNIAGALLPGGSTYLVVNYNGPLEAEPYRIHAVVQPPIENAQVESEPNDSVQTANSGAVNYYLGTLNGSAPSTDADVFAFNVDEGDVFFLSLDCDPLRNNTPINARLELVDQFANVLITANDGAFSSSTNQSPGTVAGFAPFSPAEGIVYRFTEEGTFYARITASPTAAGSAGAGDYLLSISRNGRTGQAFGNSTPSINALAVTMPQIEGQPVSLTGTVIEPDLGDSLEVRVSWGDGTDSTVSMASAGGLVLDLQHVYPPDSTPLTPSQGFVIQVLARDSFLATTSDTLDVTVENAPPTELAVVPDSAFAVPGRPLVLDGTFVDSGLSDTHTVAINWGDGTPVQSINLTAGARQFSAPHTYQTAGTTATISVTITDDDLGVGSTSTNVQVRLAPAAARFTEIIPAAGPVMRLRLQGTPDAAYTIERADVFGAWQELGTRTADAAGLFEIEDTSPTASSRFYRAVVVE